VYEISRNEYEEHEWWEDYELYKDPLWWLKEDYQKRRKNGNKDNQWDKDRQESHREIEDVWKDGYWDTQSENEESRERYKRHVCQYGGREEESEDDGKDCQEECESEGEYEDQTMEYEDQVMEYEDDKIDYQDQTIDYQDQIMEYQDQTINYEYQANELKENM